LSNHQEITEAEHKDVRTVEHFEESPTTDRILAYGSIRLGQYISPMVLIKALAIHSAESPYPRLPVIHEARSREFKSITLKLASQMFDKDMYIWMSGDTTINALKNEYGTDLDGKSLNLDEGSLLFNAMHKRSSNRWLTGVSHLYSEERYKFGIERESFELTGRISLVINIPAPQFYKHKQELFDVTLADRAFIPHSWLKAEEHRQCKERYERTAKLKPHIFIIERYSRTIRNLNEYKDELWAYAKDYGILAVRSPAECYDIVQAIASENARINLRNYLTQDDMNVVRMYRSYNVDPKVPDEPRVIGFLKEGRTYRDICHLLGKNERYKSTISHYKKRAELRGALDVNS
jgi:hypothetical protein